MSDCMTFPDTVEEFMEQYKVVDTDGVYMSKGSELVPIFRIMQWFQHESQQRWIPCGEKLPGNKQEVLVTEYGGTDIGRRFDGRWVDRYGDKMKDVTAWMPLPEPYREDGEAG